MRHTVESADHVDGFPASRGLMGTVWCFMGLVCCCVTAADLGTARIHEDAFGIPHIEADNQRDLFYALGYHTAEEDAQGVIRLALFQTGRLAEAVGPQGLQSDVRARMFGFDVLAKHIHANMHGPAREALEAYTRGFNQSLQDHREQHPGGMVRLQPYQIIASAWQPSTMREMLDGQWDLKRGRIIAQIGMKEWIRMHPVQRFTPTFDHPDDANAIRPRANTVILPESQKEILAALRKWPWDKRGKTQPGPEDAVAAVMPDQDPDEGAGSTLWIVGPSRTEHGFAAMGSEFHQAIRSRAPEAHLKAPGFHAAGKVAGPFVWVGRNAACAWSLQRNHPDISDIFVEKINPDNPDQYLHDGKWLTFETKTFVIAVRGQESVKKKVQYSIHGPVLKRVGGYAFTQRLSIQWYGGYDMMQQAYLMNTAGDLDAFKRALALQQYPLFAVGYADAKGNIYFCYNARVAKRDMSYVRWLPVPGWLSGADWEKEAIAFADLPQQTNPRSGAIAYSHTNQVSWDQTAFPETVNGCPLRTMKPDFLVQRLKALLRQTTKLSTESLWRIGMDTQSPYPGILIPRIIQAWEKRAHGYPKPEHALLTRAVALLRSWDGMCGVDARAIPLFRHWLENMTYHLFQDEHGPLTEPISILGMAHGYHNWLVCVILRPDLDLACSDTSHLQEYVDDRNTAQKETLDQVILAALLDSCRFILRSYGALSIRWGDVHRLRRGDREWAISGGDEFLRSIHATSPAWEKQGLLPARYGRFYASRGSHYCQLVVMRPGHPIWSISPFGFSNRPGSPHYSDQTPLFVEGKHKELTWRTCHE